MAIGFSGIGAGADWNGIINQLLEIESRPLNQLRSREREIEKQISDFGQVKSAIDSFKSAMDGLQDISSLEAFSGQSTDEEVLSVSATAGAVASSYDVVVTQLATYDKLASSAYADATTAIGTGTLTISVNGESVDLTVDGSNNTLTGLRDAINSANLDVAATILNETAGSRLILTSKETGAANAINVSVTDSDGNNTDANGLSRLFHIGVGDDGLAEQVTTATDALLTIDGFDITSQSNSVTGAISGVSLELSSVGSASIDIQRDNEQTETTIQGFVDAYNALMDKFDELEVSSLGSDSGLRRMEQGFVDIINQSSTLDGADAYLFEAGITRNKVGRLTLDSADLSEALGEDFGKIAAIFSDDSSGFATRLYNYTESLLEADGIIASREDGLNSRKRLLQNQIDRQEIHLDVIEKSLIDQFMALDRTMANLQSTSNYLAGQLGSMLG